jgi:hypothetical protein
LKRELNPAQSQITNVPACLTQGVTYQLGISNTASNSVYTQQYRFQQCLHLEHSGRIHR